MKHQNAFVDEGDYTPMGYKKSCVERVAVRGSYLPKIGSMDQKRLFLSNIVRQTIGLNTEAALSSRRSGSKIMVKPSHSFKLKKDIGFKSR